MHNRSAANGKRVPKEPPVGIVLGLWLSGIFASSLFGRLYFNEDQVWQLQIVIAASLVWPFGFFVFSRCRFVPKRLSAGVFISILCYGVFAFLSTIVSAQVYQSIGYLFLTLVTIWIVLQFNSNLDENNYEVGLRVYAFTTACFLVAFAIYDYVPGERLGNGRNILNPNAIALVTFSVALGATAFRALSLRLVMLGGLLGILVLTGSRASTVAAIIGIITISIMRWRHLNTNRKLLSVFFIFVIFGFSLYFLDEILGSVIDFLALQDPYRGIGTGMSGRVVAWQATWQLLLENPVMGVGFRAHEQLLGAGSSAHNGYLTTLAEIGLLGFLSILYLIISGLYRLWCSTISSESVYSYSIVFGIVCGYLLLAIFERYLINIGNPTSVLFLLGILPRGLARQSNADSNAGCQVGTRSSTGDRQIGR